MNAGSILVGLILLAIIISIIVSLIKKKKQGQPVGCDGCGKCGIAQASGQSCFITDKEGCANNPPCCGSNFEELLNQFDEDKSKNAK